MQKISTCWKRVIYHATPSDKNEGIDKFKHFEFQILERKWNLLG